MISETHVFCGLLQLFRDELLPLAFLQTSLGLRSPLCCSLCCQSSLGCCLGLCLGFSQGLGFAPSARHPATLGQLLLRRLLDGCGHFNFDRSPAARLFGLRGRFQMYELWCSWIRLFIDAFEELDVLLELNPPTKKPEYYNNIAKLM